MATPHLAALGAYVLHAALGSGEVGRLADEFGARVAVDVVLLDQVQNAACDVYAPCAVGTTVNADTVPPIRCHIIVNSVRGILREA